MVKIPPHELHLIALICANANHPQFSEWLNRLSPIARAVAILILQNLAPGKYSQIPLPPEVLDNKDIQSEVREAAVEFGRMLNGRRREHELRMQYAEDTAHPLGEVERHA